MRIDQGDDYKAIVARIKETQESLQKAGLSALLTLPPVSIETALLVMIYKEVRSQPEDRLGQKLAGIQSSLTSILSTIVAKK